MTDMKMTDQIAEHEIAGHEIAWQISFYCCFSIPSNFSSIVENLM